MFLMNYDPIFDNYEVTFQIPRELIKSFYKGNREAVSKISDIIICGLLQNPERDRYVKNNE